MPRPVLGDSLATLRQPSPLDPARLLATSRVAIGEVSLLPGLGIAASISLDRASLTVEARAFGLAVWSTTLSAEKIEERWSGHQGRLKEDLAFRADFGKGELEVSGDACLELAGAWHCARFDEVVLRWAPGVGEVAGTELAHAPTITDPGGTPSRSIVPTITRIFVEPGQRAGTDVGAIVKQAYFQTLPDFVFNVAFAVGAFPVGGAGPYTDPRSPWFNVFAGYYQIDCPKPAWTRPFGYDPVKGARSPRFDEMLRLGKADWNFFSNWMYGVPREAIAPYEPVESSVPCTLLGQRRAGAGEWDVVDIDGFSVVTAYSPKGPEGLVENSAITRLWRVTYGEPTVVAGLDAAFPGAKMHARFLVSFAESADAFHTWFFGGTVNKSFDGPENEAFLAAQLDAGARIIDEHYATLGFTR